MERKMVVTQRECPGRMVPSGTPITVPAHQFVSIAQALGGSYTIILDGNMVRIDGTDADVLGLEAEELSFDTPPNDDIQSTQVWDTLKTIYDPEIPVDLVNLGLVYGVDIDQTSKTVAVRLTLTAPTCGMGPVLVGDVEYRLSKVPNVQQVEVELVLDPPWSRDMMSEEAQLVTGMFY